MKRFYLLRHEDLSGNSGVGVVAEGVIFDDGTGVYTWLTPMKTVTVFMKIADIKNMHSHGGCTETIIESVDARFEECQAKVRELKNEAKRLKREARKVKKELNK